MQDLHDYGNAISRGKLIQAVNDPNDFWDDFRKYTDFALQVITVLGKYFFKNGKLFAPSPLMFWKYFALAGELYILFKSFKNTKN